MPLSDKERRVLDQLERQLAGPTETRNETGHPAENFWSRLTISAVAALAGTIIVLAGVVVDNVAGVVAATGGFVIIVGAVMFSADILAQVASSFITNLRSAAQTAPRQRY